MPPPKKITSVHQLRVVLQNVMPPVWRRLEVSSDITLVRLHRILQIAMGWQNCHLHLFVARGVTYAIPDPEDPWPAGTRNEYRAKLGTVLSDIGDSLIYEYDFGDGWRHQVVVEAVMPPEEGVTYPRCISGRRACPPEDVGGPASYTEFLEALRNPNHPERSMYLDWIGGDFDPDHLDLDEINVELGMD